jgi:hypothetical protein
MQISSEARSGLSLNFFVAEKFGVVADISRAGRELSTIRLRRFTTMRLRSNRGAERNIVQSVPFP